MHHKIRRITLPDAPKKRFPAGRWAELPEYVTDLSENGGLNWALRIDLVQTND